MVKVTNNNFTVLSLCENIFDHILGSPDLMEILKIPTTQKLLKQFYLFFYIRLIKKI